MLADKLTQRARSTRELKSRDESSSASISDGSGSGIASDEDNTTVTELSSTVNGQAEDVLAFDAEVPPGPYWLEWVDGLAFTAIASLVIILNVVMMVAEAMHAESGEKYADIDQLFMLFYITEILLKACLWQNRWLLGPCQRIRWNWLDLVIVGTGCLDMYIMPLLHDLGLVENDSEALRLAPFIRVLRLLRLARLLKIVKVFWTSDLSWTEGERFQVFMMSVICASCIIMGFEADFPDFFLWFYLEQIVLGIFTFELITRLKHLGWMFFSLPGDIVWNWLDFIIVVGGVVDQWMMPTLELVAVLAGNRNSMDTGHFGKVMMMLRMARLLRILRLVRLIKNIPPLFALLKGITQAMAGMMWVLLLTMVLLYACTLLCVKVIRDGIVYDGDTPVDVVAVFPDVPDTFFTLFTIMNGNTSELEPLLSTLPLSKIVFMLFTIVSSWAILSILTAVVSENMINTTEQLQKEQQKEEAREKAAQRRARINEIFDTIDNDGDGEISYEEFQALLKDEAILEELCVQAQMPAGDLYDVFKVTERGGCVNRAKFIKSVEIEHDSVTIRSFLRLEKHLEQLHEEIAGLRDTRH